jgi:lipopolysaccharide heptosyltransferase II
MKRILVFNVNWLGDALFSTAVIRNIKLNFPDSFLACIIPSRCFQVLKDNPYLDEVIIFDDKDRHRSIGAKWNFIKILKERNFDTVFLLHRSFSRALICWLAGIRTRIGYYTKKRGFLLTRKIAMPKMDEMHRIDYYLNIIEKCGLRIEDRCTDFSLGAREIGFVEYFLAKKSVRQDDFLAVINPGGNWLPKRWPKEYWVKLADRLVGELKAKVIISGDAADIDLCNSITEKMKEKAIPACGLLNIKQFAALCKRADVFITADTGPLHIANAVNTKRIIALFGPTSARITGPYPMKNVFILQKDVGCKIPCYVKNCKDNRCMKGITVDEVFEKIKSQIKHG